MKIEQIRIAQLFLLLTTVAISQPLYSQSAHSSTGGRYVIISTQAGQYAETHILDTETGRVWMERGQASAHPFFIPCGYQSLDGAVSLIPVDTKAELEAMTPSNIAQNSNTNVPKDVSDRIDRIEAKSAKLETLNDEAMRAEKEAYVWKELLERVKLGKSIKPLAGWKAGEPVYGEEMSASDELAELLKNNIEKCLKVRDEKQQLIKQLQDKTP